MKNYFELTNFKYNITELQKLFVSNKNDWVTYGTDKHKSLHTQYIPLNNEYIKEILNNFQNDTIVENIKFFKTLSHCEVSPHTDKRNVAINLPIFVDNKSYTVFYDSVNEIENPTITIKNTIQTTKAKKFIKGKVIDKFYLNNAVCLNTNIPHGVINNSDNDRIIISISFREQFDDFEKIKKLYDTRNLTRT